MKKTGIWIDSKKAWIYKLDKEKEEFEQIVSEVEDTRASGGYGGAIPYAAQVANPDDKIQNRKNQQFKNFFDEISKKVHDSDEILIEGPAEAKLGLLRFIKEINSMKDVNLEMRNADKRTENQFRAEVKNYFK